MPQTENRFWNRHVEVCFAGAVSTGERNTLIFLERWSVRDEVSDADILHGQTEVRDVGSLAARGVDEFDWAAFQSCIVFDLPSFGPVWRHPTTCPQKVAICFELNRARGDISRLGFRAVPAINRQKPEPVAFDDQPRGAQEWWASGLSRGTLRSACLGLRNTTQTM